MNGDYLLAERLIEIFTIEAGRMYVSEPQIAASYSRIADSFQALLDEHNPPKKVTDRDVSPLKPEN